jgi:BRCT domain type II-containing protein
MGSKTAEATAKKYGANAVSKLENADYIVVGKKPGDKQAAKIADSEAIQLTEEQFVDLIVTGLPERFKRLADEGEEAEEERPSKKQKQKE